MEWVRAECIEKQSRHSWLEEGDSRVCARSEDPRLSERVGNDMWEEPLNSTYCGKMIRRKGEKEKDSAWERRGYPGWVGAHGKKTESRSPRKGGERSRESPCWKPGPLLVSAVNQ